MKLANQNNPSDVPDAPIKRINLGLQGGGSHGAFTWGVLDELLQDRSIEIEGISGTSAGAMNAVALAHGFAPVSYTHLDVYKRQTGASSGSLLPLWDACCWCPHWPGCQNQTAAA